MSNKVSRATVTTPPASEPITSDEAKKQLEIASSDTTHDAQLTLLIQAAREQWEHDTDSACLTQTLQVNLECFYSDRIELPKRPIQSITEIAYYDSDDTTQTLSTDVYSLDAARREIRLKSTQSWPITYDRWDAVTVTYVAGYASSALVPSIHKQAMLLLVAHYFENRDMLMSDAMQSMRAYSNLVERFMRSSYP